MNAIIVRDGQPVGIETDRVGKTIDPELVARLRAAVLQTFTGPARKPVVITTDDGRGNP